MKRILSTALAIVLFAATSQAQTTDDGKGSHAGKRGEMMKELNLTTDQKTKLKSIHEAERAEMKALKSDGKTDEDKTARKAVHEKYRTQIEAVLTPGQTAKLKEEKTQARVEHEGDANDAHGKMAGAAKELDLTADQKTKVQSINSEFKTKMQALRNNTAVSGADRKAQVKQLAEEHHRQLQAVLTPEQMAKLNEKRVGRKGLSGSNL